MLSDPEKRKAYDEVRRLGPAGGRVRRLRRQRPRRPTGRGRRRRAAGSASPPTTWATWATCWAACSDGAGPAAARSAARRRRAGRGVAGARRGDDYETELHLSFLDAVNGVTTTVNLTSEATCSTCHGTGAAPGTSPVVCPRCAGRGVLDDNQGLFSFSRACPECGGRGMKVETPCPTCRGTGSEVRPRQVKVRIPAGVDEGQRIRLKGKGGSGGVNGTPGDLCVTVRVSPHTLFGRKGRDLTLTVPITFTEAVLGADVTVPTLDGPVVRPHPGRHQVGAHVPGQGQGRRRAPRASATCW